MTKRRPAAACVGLAAFLQAGLVHAYTSPYSGMAVAGTFNGWNPAANLSLIADNTWQGSFYLPLAQRSEFKFAANGAWTDDWGETNQSDFSEPVSGVAEYKGSNIAISNTVGDLYVFTFNDSSRAYTVELRARSPYQTNLLRNASFETAGSTSERAQSWEYNNPDAHGSYWGSAARADWRHYPETQGAYEGVVRGTWAGMGDIGGWWQEGPADGGMTYEASAWFWADAAPPYGPWSATLQELKIEFFSPAYQQLGLSATNFQDVADGWTQKIVRGTAPAGTAWARFVVSVVGAGPAGALNVDHADLRALVSRSQSFSDWATPDADAAYTRGGWLIRTGRTTTVNARSGYAASLPNPTGSPFDGNHVQSPCFTNGVGTLSFWYRHGHTDTNSEPEEAAAFAILKSLDGVNWSTVSTFTNVSSLQYELYSKNIGESGPIYLRIQHGGGTNRILVDDIVAAEPASSARFQDFNSWPDSTATNGCHLFQDWMVCSGRVSATNAKDGKSAALPGNPSAPNYVRSPFLTNGYGAISFWYARGTNGIGPAAWSLQSSPDGVIWATLAAVSNIASSSYTEFSQYFYSDQGVYLRIRNESGTGLTTLLLEEHFDSLPTAPIGWTLSGTDRYTSESSSGDDPPSLKFDTTGDFAETSLVPSPTNVTFWIKGFTTDADSSLALLGISGSSTTTVATVQPVPTTETIKSYALSTNFTRLRFVYTKSAGNAGLDDVYIRGFPVSVSLPQELLLDDISLGDPLLVRFQDFDSWPRKDSYAGAPSEFQGWVFTNAFTVSNALVITAPENFSGQSARMYSGVGTAIVSPFLPDGVGPITFQYRNWETSPVVTYDLQTSADGLSWATLTNIPMSSTNYAEFSFYRFSTNGAYIRLYHASGNERALFDDINIRRPQPPADVEMGSSIEPLIPFTNDPVYVWASVIPRYEASDIAVTTYYRIGTTGVFSPLPMSLWDFVNYRTTSAIPAQPAGTVVQYYLACAFGGPGSAVTSPRYYPSGGPTNPASYGIPRILPGQVWINEVKYFGFFPEYQFIELCGVAGIDIGRWKIQWYDGSSGANPYLFDSYTIANGTTLPNDAGGYGFWVLGGSNVVNRDMAFTNDLLSHLPSGLRLLNEVGGIEYAVSLDGVVNGFDPIYAKDEEWFGLESIQLSGTGTNFDDFTWITNGVTPGAVNAGQSFGSSEPPPEVDIYWMEMGTSVTLRTVGNTNNWSAAPYSATNLPGYSPAWGPVTPFSSTFAGGTNVIWFNRPAGGPLYLYRVLFTQP
jgi:hypothetical protein